MEMFELPEPSQGSCTAASQIIEYANNLRCPNDSAFYCPDCRGYPKRPVTGICGHTRCTICIEKRGPCYCRAPLYYISRVDVLVQELLKKMFPDKDNTCSGTLLKSTSTGRKISTRSLRWRPNTLESGEPCSASDRYVLLSFLIKSKRYKEAVPHLAILAVSKRGTMRSKYIRQLAQLIEVISESTDLQLLVPELFHAVLKESCASAGVKRLQPSDLECSICSNVLKSPMTTPCGHTFCFYCLKRMAATTSQCALCRMSVNETLVKYLDQNQFINSILASLPINDYPSVEDEFIPIFKHRYRVAFPSVAYHLMLLDDDSCDVVQRMLDTGCRQFGMVGSDPSNSTSEMYGTMLEIKDCVPLRDGRLILSNIGVSRFKILEKISIDGVMRARVEKHVDSYEHTREMQMNIALKSIIKKKSLLCMRLSPKVLADIEGYLGPIEREMDVCNTEGQWWGKPDGPNLLWWLASVLPLEPFVQGHLLSICLEDRIKVVATGINQLLNMSKDDLFAMVSSRLKMRELSNCD